MSLPQPKNPQELEKVLSMMLAPDTEQVRQAGAILKQFMKKSTCVEPLMQQISASSMPEARQSAAVLLRRKINNHWAKLNDNVKAEIKQVLLLRLMQETSRPVKLSVAALISALSRKTIPDGKWPELLNFLLQSCSSQETAQREVSMLLFRALAENIGEHLKPHFKVLQQIFKRGLGDPSLAVQSEALKALGVLVEYLDSDQAVIDFREVIPPMVECVKRFVQQDEEEAAAVAFETFDTLADSPAPVLHAHIPLILPFMAEIAVNKNLDINIREKASLFICSFVEGKPGKVAKHALVEGMLKACFMLCVEPYEDVWEAGEMTPQKMCVEILDSCMLHLPKRLVFGPGVQHAQALLNSGNPVERKGGLVILAVMAEGCAELLRDNLTPYVQVLCKSLRDGSPLVRAAACVALTQFADYVQPEITEYHKEVLPALFFALDNATETVTVKKKCCTALEVFCEHLGSDILAYVDGLMNKLVMLLNTNDLQIQESVVSAIKSCARSSGEKFLPYFPTTMKIMAQFLLHKDDEHLKLRAMATECVGAMGLAVGKEHFKGVLQDTIRLAIEGMSLDFFQLRESTYSFFDSLALMLGPEFQALLTTVLPLLLGTLFSDDGVIIHQSDDAPAMGGDADDALEESDPDGDEGDEDNARVKLSIRSGALDEKVQALATLSTFFSAVGEPVLPFLDKILEALDELSEYPHPYVRHAVVSCLQDLVGLMHTAFPNQQKWSRGVAVPLDQRAAQVIDKVLPLILSRLSEEEDRNTAAAACEALVDICKLFGPAAVQAKLQDIYKMLGTLVHEEAPCQMNYDTEDPEAEDHDEILIDSVTDLVGALASLVGPAFEPVFREMFPALMKFNQAKRNASDRSMAIGTVAEVAEEIGEAIAPYLDQIFPVLVAGLRDPFVQLRRNSAYCTGVLCDVAAKHTHKAYPELLNALEPLLRPNPEDPAYAKHKDHFLACKDNAVSAIARMIAKGAQALPMERAVPLYLSGLPLQSDFSEAKNAYPILPHLFKSHPQIMLANLEVVVKVLGSALGNSNIPDEVQAPLALLAKQLAQQCGPQLKEQMGKLPKDQANSLLRFLQ